MNGNWHPGPRPTYHNPACPHPSQDDGELADLPPGLSKDLMVEPWIRGGGVAVRSYKLFGWLAAILSVFVTRCKS